MSEIVYYDANKTVRQLMLRQFAGYGLKVVEMPSLDKCEEVLAQCTHPVILLVDMSRQPEMLPKLQAVVPKYIRDPERCILTSITPTALARYLPPRIEDCFFKHVVERPFKRVDFIHFFENIAYPYLREPSAVHARVPSSVVSSVSQITGQIHIDLEDEGLRHQIEEIVSSQSVSLQQLQEDARGDMRQAAVGHDERLMGEHYREVRKSIGDLGDAAVRVKHPQAPAVVAPAQTAPLVSSIPMAVVVDKHRTMSPDLEKFENGRTLQTQVPPNLNMYHPESEDPYPHTLAFVGSQNHGDKQRLDNPGHMASIEVPERHSRVMPPALPNTRGGVPEPSLNSMAPVPEQRPMAPELEPAPKPAIVAGPHQRATVPGKENKRPTISSERKRDELGSGNIHKPGENTPQSPEKPTENRAQIIGHLANFNPSPTSEKPTENRAQIIGHLANFNPSPTSKKPTENCAQIIGHLANFNPTSHKPTRQPRGQASDVGRMHVHAVGDALKAAMAENGRSAEKSEAKAPVKPTPELPVEPKVEQSVRQQAVRRQRAQTPNMAPTAQGTNKVGAKSESNAPATSKEEKEEKAVSPNRTKTTRTDISNCQLESSHTVPVIHGLKYDILSQNSVQNLLETTQTNIDSEKYETPEVAQDHKPGSINNPYLAKRKTLVQRQIIVVDDLDGNTTDNAPIEFDEECLKSETNHILMAIEDGSRLIEEDENTLIVSPALLNGIAPVASVPSPTLMQKPTLQSLAPIMQSRMSLGFMLQALKQSLMENSRITLSCREGTKNHVAFLDAGRMLWFETVCPGRVSDSENYLQGLPEDLKLPISELVERVKQKMTLAQAFSALDLDVTAIELCEKQLISQIQTIHTMEDKPVDIHRGIPLPWQPLFTHRPCQSLPACAYLFEEFRKRADDMPLPQNFHYMSFAMRPYRTPLNAAIELNADENELLSAMKSPISIAELQKIGKPAYMTMLYRLVMFEFADYVN